ncbi:hypothetical protein INT45_007788 [Circinella minor]|uniref:VWFA domain-containing protein n=1 Tax=Circinella minor TaxID=1195481 RepID=A0A8H7RXQ8_9FUNG|nr:hypothetical protein INT45_007788 [Circinella minor]
MSIVDDNNTVVSTTSSTINNNNNVTHLSGQNLKSARSAILFTKNATFHSRTTLTLWLLNRMFEPIDPSYEHEGMSFLEISNNALSSVPSTPTVTQQQQQHDEDTNTGTTKITKEAMILTPRTRILSIANEYSIVIMVDLSSSLATTDVNRGNIMIDNIYDTLCNILIGLAQPFSLPTTTSSNILFEPTIRLTVIAECSQFGSNINVIPILAEFPTMRVFLQNVRVIQSNVSSILKILHDYIATFLRDLATFRQRLTQRRSKLGYELDVRRNHSSGMIDHEDEPGSQHNHGHQENVLFKSTRTVEQQQTTSTSTSTQQKSTKKKVQKDGKSSTPNKKSKTTKISSSQGNSNTQQKIPSSATTPNTTANRSNSQQLLNNESQKKKDIWGVGKTGSNLSYILHAALFALNLLPATGQQSLILLTDGVVKSNIQDELIIRQLSSDGVTCSVVQISPGPFMDCNFGFIPDTDILKFVASATGGQYVHIEELLASNNNNKNNKNTRKKKPSITTTKKTAGGDILDRIIGDLTLPQRKFLLHEISLDKSAAMIRTTNTSTAPGGGVRSTATTTTTTKENSHQQSGNEYLAMGARNGFPWNPHAEPEMTESKLLRYQEYTLPNQLSHVISARTRQGFSLHSITLDRRRATPLNSSSSLSRGITMMGTNNGKKTQVVITLSLQWQPQITIEYRIRAVLSLLSSSSDRIISSYFGTGTIFEDGVENDTNHESTANFGRLLASLTNPKAEILIRANSTFSHLLRNWDQFQRRFQVMGIFNNNASASTASSNIGNLSGSAGILKISKLKQLLTTISEADKHLNTLLMLNNNNSNTNNTNNRNMMILLNQRKPAIAPSSPTSYISQFQEIWQKMDDSSDIRHQTSCWYDTNHSFDLILHFTPYYCYTTDYNHSNYNSSITNNVTAPAATLSTFITSAENAVISTVLDVLIDLLRQMTDFVSHRGTFIKITPPTTTDNDDSRMYEIQVAHENLRTIHVDVRFFNTPLDMRLHIMEELVYISSTRINLNEGQILTDLDIGGPTMTTTINDGSTTASSTTNAFMARSSLSAVKIEIAKRPLFNLLMRDSEHYFGITKGHEEGGVGGYYRKRPTTPALLAGEYIVRNYLRRQRWSWDTKILTTDGGENSFYGLQLLHDLAFERLCKARLAEGYVLISFNEATCHFYKEYKDRNNTTIERSSQYFIWRDPTKQILTTELWLEPVTRREAQNRIIERDIVQTEQRRLFQQDRKILSKLITFDWTFVAGYQQQREGGNSPAPPVASIANRMGNNSDDNKHLALDNDLLGNHHIKKAMVIDISSVLRSSTFSIAIYPCPRQQEEQGQIMDNSTHSYNLYLSPSPITQSFIKQQHPNDNSIVYNDENYQKMGVVWLQTERYLPLTAPAQMIAAVPNKSEDSHSRSWHGNAAASPSIGLVRGGSYNNQSSSTCHCPRPDQEFLTYREALSDLPSSYRDVVLTHYYFQQYLRVLADCEMDTKSNLPNDNFWCNFFRETMYAKNNTHAPKSTLRLLHRITDMQCFIKTFNPSTFIAVLVPSLATLVQHHTSFTDDDKHDKSKTTMTDNLGLLLFECYRQTPTRSADLYHHYDEEGGGGEEDHISSSKRGGGYMFKEIDFASIKESILSPHLTNGYSSNNSNNKTINETIYNNEDSQQQQQQKILSDYKSRLLQDITDIYSSCFAKSIYSSLLFGSIVSDQDFDKVLDICEETVLDIDLTGYLNVQTLLRRNGRTSVEEWSSAQQRFSSVLEHHFEPVMYSKRKRQFIYCYRPAHVKIGQHNKQDLAGGNGKLTKLADIVISAQCPLFIRLEYTLRNPKYSTTKTFPLEFLPTSYNEGDHNNIGANEEQQQQHGSRGNDYEPIDIGSLESPVASVDGSSATVRLVCMTIPQTKYSPVIHARHSHGCPAESPVHHQSSFFDNEGEYREALSGLSAEKQDALIETKARLTWLLTEEVMHGLLRAGPVTDVVVRYIQSHLMKKNPFVDFPTTMVIPLVFVKDQQMSRRIFLEQLERNSMTPYKLVRVGDCFYATDQKEYNDIFYTGESNDFYRSSETASNNNNNNNNQQQQQQEEEGADFYMDLGIELYTDNKSQQQRQEGQQDNVAGSPNDEFCEGLGISIMEPDVFSDEEGPTNTSSVLDNQAYQQLYWLLIIPRSQTVQIYFYSKMPQFVNRSEIVRMTKVMINHAIERTNKLVLLQHLNATRVCSKYLLANEDSTNKNIIDMSTDESSDDSNNNNNNNKHSNNRGRATNGTQSTGGNNLVEMLSTSGEEASFTPPKKFRPGQFACDIIFTWRFPLHWRLQPNVALNALSSDVLRHFTVKNRPNIFVCMRDDTVIYCTLRETTVINHYTDGTSIIDYSITTDEQQGSTAMRGTSPHNSLLTNMGISDTSNMAAFSHHHSRTQSAQPTSTVETATAAYSYSHQQQQEYYSSYHYTGTVATNTSSRRTSPRSSPGGGGKLQSTNSIQLSPEPRKQARAVESRELVLEVYGVDLPNWISDELVDLLENRLMSHVTLKEVQQFLLRNPGSKLSRADIDFILPVDKPPSVHESMQVPSNIHDIPQFALLLRESILTNSIRVLTGNGLASSLKNYRLRQQYNNMNFGKGFYFSATKDNVNSSHGESSSVEELCFYYSCINRTPGVCTDLELCIGQGVAGVIISFHDSLVENNDSHQNTSTVMDTEKEDTVPRSLLSAFASKSSAGNIHQQQQQYDKRISIEIWTVGQVDAKALYDHVYKCFRQSICDYIIEQAVSSTLPLSTAAAIERQQQFTTSAEEPTATTTTSSSPFLEEIGNVQLSSLLSSFVHVLEDSFHWNNPSVSMVTYPVKLQPWCLNQVVQRLNADFIDLNSNIKSVIGIRQQEEQDHYQEQQHQSHQQQDNINSHSIKDMYYKICYTSADLKHNAQAMMQPQKNIRYAIISGLTEFSGCKHYHGPTRPEPTAANVTASTATITEDNKSVLAYNRSEIASILRADQNSAHSRHESVASSNVDNNSNNNKNNNITSNNNKLSQKLTSPSYKEASHRRAFHLVIFDADSFTLYTYNYTKLFIDQLVQVIEQAVNHQSNRVRMLQNIMHQKLGLFRHSETFSAILRNSNDNTVSTSSSSISENDSTSSVEILKSLVNNNMYFTSNVGLEPISANTMNISLTTTGRPSLSAASSATRLSNVKISSSPTTTAPAMKTHPFHPSSGKLLKNCNTALQDAYTSPVTRSLAITTVVEEDDQKQFPDHLTEHGTPFLDTFLQHSQLRAAHDKAFNVYIKWASRYSSAWMQQKQQHGNIETEKKDCNSADINNSASEMMSVTELRLILKASRLLHFCRTPLVFSDVDPKRSSIFSNTANYTARTNNIETIQQHHHMEEAMIWYEGLAHTFMSEYASYLQSVGMHVIVHGVSGNSNSSKEDQGAYLSYYKVANDFSVRSPVIYLLQVYPGGTIMCEARLTDVFVSVTLYTLHRRYGRLAAMNHSPYMHESSEKRRADFQDFTEECDRFKQKIHVNSFVYDFNLKFIQQSLDQASSLPSSINLLGIIKNTFSLYYKPANYSRNRIVRGIYELVPNNEEEDVGEDNSMTHLLSMVIRNAPKYGFESLYTNGVPTACFVSSNDPSFTKTYGGSRNNKSYYRYTLVITDDHHSGGGNSSNNVSREGNTNLGMSHQYDYAESPQQDNISTTPTTITTTKNDMKVTVEYFIIVTYQEDPSEGYQAKKERAWNHSPGYKSRSLTGSLEEVLKPEKHTLKDVTLRARQRIDDLMKQAVFLYQQDVMWNQLYQFIGNKKMITENVQEFVDLADGFYTLDAISTEASLQRFLHLNLTWDSLLNTIHRFYPNTSRILIQQQNSSFIRRHLILFNPSAVQEYFVHIIASFSLVSSTSSSSGSTVKQQKKSVQIFAKSKQPRATPNILDRTEKLFIGDLAVILGYCLWKNTK